MPLVVNEGIRAEDVERAAARGVVGASILAAPFLAASSMQHLRCTDPSISTEWLWDTSVSEEPPLQILAVRKNNPWHETNSAPRMTGRRSHWTERGDDNIFFTFGHCGALVPSLAANGLVVMAPSCVNSLHPSAEEPWEEMTKIEPRNKMLYSPGSDQ